MYTPTYLQWLDSVEKHGNGWPKFVDDAAQEWATRRVKEILVEADGPLPLWVIAKRLLSEPHQSELPECLRGMALLDAKHGVTFRALLTDCHQEWVAHSPW